MHSGAMFREGRMQLAWMRGSDAHAPQLSITQWRSIVAQSDELGFRQVHWAGSGPDTLGELPRLSRLKIGIDVARFGSHAPRALVGAIQRATDLMEGRLVLALKTGHSPRDRTTGQMFETVLSEPTPHMVQSDMRMAAPRPEVLVVAKAGTTPGVARAAANGFHVLSPAWQTRQELSRQWPAIVAGATHAARRSCPSHWHVARCIFVSDDRAAVAAYRQGVALAYFKRAAVAQVMAGKFVIAGSAAEVAAQVSRLRARVGPFGTLHCIDPGLDAAEGLRQRARLVSQVLPRMTGSETSTPEKILERT